MKERLTATMIAGLKIITGDTRGYGYAHGRTFAVLWQREYLEREPGSSYKYRLTVYGEAAIKRFEESQVKASPKTPAERSKAYRDRKRVTQSRETPAVD